MPVLPLPVAAAGGAADNGLALPLLVALRAQLGLLVQHAHRQGVHHHHDGQRDEEGEDGAVDDEVLVGQQALAVLKDVVLADDTEHGDG